jgi:hypothetical protein
MIDRHEHVNKREIIYGEYLFNFSNLKVQKEKYWFKGRVMFKIK